MKKIFITTGFILLSGIYLNARATDLEQFVCDTDKSITCFNISNTGDMFEDIKKDKEVCNCLENRFELNIKSSLTPEEAKKRDQEILEAKILNQLAKVDRRAKQKTHPYLLEAILIDPANPKEAIKQILDTSESRELFAKTKEILDKYKDKVSPEFYSKRMAEVENYQDRQEENLIQKIQKSREFEKENGLCISYEDYLKSKTIPSSPQFWQFLDNTKKFNVSDWDYGALLSSAISGDELARAKLEFMEMNPTLKVAFRGDNLEIKEKLYNFLRDTLITERQCVERGTCQGLFFKKFKSIPELLRPVYEQPNARKGVSAELFKEVGEEIHNLGIAESLNLTLADVRVASSHGGTTYNKCGGGIDPRNVPACADMLKNYCTNLRTIEDNKIRPAQVPGITRFTFEDQALAPPEVNEEYLAMNQKECHERKRILNKTEMTYQDFKKQQCSSPETCQNISDVELYNQFLKSSESINKGFFRNKKQENGEILAEAMSSSTKLEIDDDIMRMSSNKSVVTSAGSNSHKSAPSIVDVIDNIGKDKPTFNEQLKSNQPEFISNTLSTSTGSNSSEVEQLNNGSDLNQPLIGNVPYQTNINVPNPLSGIRDEIKDPENFNLSSSIAKVDVDSEESLKDDKSSLEERIKGLEKLLEQKDENSKSYQKLISQLLEQKQATQEKKNEDIQSKQLTDENFVQKKTVKAAPVAPYKVSKENALIAPEAVKSQISQQGRVASSQISRAPASVSAPTSAQMAVSNKRVNNALLAKYGIVVKESSSGTSSVSVAEEAESSKFSSVSSMKEAADVPLKVSLNEFQQIKVNNLGALEALYSKELKGIDDQVVKVLVSTNDSKEVLEFYAVKEQGKVVFQPLRKNKLTDLQNALQQ